MGVQIADIMEKTELSFEEVPRLVAVDAFNTIYQFLSIIRQADGTPLMDSEGRITSHLSGLFYRTGNLLSKGMTPVFVFDGKPSDMKKRTIEQRAERKREAEEKLAAAREKGDLEGIRVYAQQTSRLTNEMVEESKHLLWLMGVPVVQAASEGEAQCAVMCEKGLVEAAASQDYDTLLFGTPVLVKNLTIAGRRKLPRKNSFIDVVPERIDLQANLQRLGITRKKLVWIGILAGTDFNEGVKGIGAKKALKLVREHDDFGAICRDVGREIDFSPVEGLFLEPPYEPVAKEELRMRPPDRDKLLEYMLSRSFSADRIDAALKRAFKDPLGSKQDTLEKFF
ncbi:MAG: flap endonuclease-1 [Candidatus Micrarchaeota archaeon]